LRLFVRCAIDAMARKQNAGKLRERQCLFLLDEFFTLGYIDEIAKAAGLMRGYGLQLWPILQDLGQLRKLYGRDGAETFFGNADAHIFFGNTDMETLEYVSKGFGVFTQQEVNTPYTPSKNDFEFEEPRFGFFGSMLMDESERQRLRREEHERQKTDWSVEEENRMRGYQAAMQKAMNRVGKPRMPPDEVRRTVAKGDGDPVARRMIIFGKGDERLILSPAPYFLEKSETREPPKPDAENEAPFTGTREDWKKKYDRKYRVSTEAIKASPFVKFDHIDTLEIMDKESWDGLQSIVWFWHYKDRTTKELDEEIWQTNNNFRVYSFICERVGNAQSGWILKVRKRPWYARLAKKVLKV